MKITSLELDGYGVWTGLRLEGLSDGLSVVYGPNEAGKTTLMQFVRSVLYGFSGARRGYLPPLRGGRPGGSLSVAGSQGNYQICRHQNEQFPDDGDLVSLLADDGTRQGEPLLKSLLYNIDEKIFNNVFAVGLHELQELATLSDTEAAAQLYNLSVGLDRVSLVEVVRELETSRKRLLDPGGRPSQIVQLVGQRERLREELETLRASTGRYASLAADLKQAEKEVARLEDENARLQQHAHTVEAAIAVGDRWNQSTNLTRQLAAMDSGDAIPDGAVRRLETTNDRLNRYHNRIRQLKHERTEIRNEAGSLEINETLWRLAPRVEALGEQEDWIVSLQRRTSELETEINGLETELGDERSRLGLDSGVDGRLPEFSLRRLSALRPPARQLREAKRQVAEAEQEIVAAEANAKQLSDQIGMALAAKGESDLAQSMARASGLVAQLRRRLDIDDRIDQMERHQLELESQSRELLGRQLLPAWVLVGVGAVFVVGVLSLMAGLFMPASVTGAFGWPLAVLGLIGTVAAVGAKFAIERSNTRQMDSCQKQIVMLQSQTRQAKNDRSQLDVELPRGDGPLDVRLAAAEKVLASLEELIPLDARREAAEQEAQAAGLLAAEAKREAAAATTRWRDALRAVGLPEKFSPKQIRQVAAASGRIGQVQRQLDLRYEEFQQRSRELESIIGRITQLASDARLTTENKEPIEVIRALAARVQEQEVWIARRETLRRRARRLRTKLGKADMAVARLKHRKRKLFHAAGVDSEEHLRRLVDEAARATALRRQRDALEREIDAAIGNRTTRQAVADELNAEHIEPLEMRREQLRKRCQSVETALRQEFEKRGRLAEQLKQLANDRGPAEKQIELDVVERRLSEAVHTWRKLAVAGRILGDIRASYERDRQPVTLQEASTYLDSLTDGRYVRVWTPLDEDVLLVEDGHGESLPVHVLSQGTREQLFLCLRLALASGYAQRGAALPLVLDDVLVNFDARRAKTAAAVFRDFAAAGHQMIVFTCHEHIVKLFKSLRVDVLTLPDNSKTGVTISLGTATTKPKRKPKVEPKEVPVEPVHEEPAAAEIAIPEVEPVEEETVELEDEPADWEESIEAEEVWDEEEEQEDLDDEYEEEEAEDELVEEEEVDDEAEYELVEEEEEEYALVDEEEDEEKEYAFADEGEEEEDEYELVDEFEEEEEEEYDEEPYDEVEEVDDIEEDVDEEELDDELVDEDATDDLRRRRGYHDDWDDRYEDEYEYDDDETDGDHLDGAEAA